MNIYEMFKVVEGEGIICQVCKEKVESGIFNLCEHYNSHPQPPISEKEGFELAYLKLRRGIKIVIVGSDFASNIGKILKDAMHNGHKHLVIDWNEKMDPEMLYADAEGNSFRISEEITTVIINDKPPIKIEAPFPIDDPPLITTNYIPFHQKENKFKKQQEKFAARRSGFKPLRRK